MVKNPNPSNPLGNPIPLNQALSKQAPIEEDFSWLPHGNLSEKERKAIYEQRGYDGVRSGFENFMHSWYTNYAAFFKNCSRHGKIHLLWGCQHIEEQDPVHPDGIVIVPVKKRCYLLCIPCFLLLQEKRLNLGNEMRMVCEKCAFDVVQRVQKINPNLAQDLRVQKEFFRP